MSIEEQLNTICKHNRDKQECKTCKSYCQHNKQKATCRECGGSIFCIHDKRKARCRECDGSSFCIHNKFKATCRECDGSSFCQHNKRKSDCQICEPIKYLVNLQRTHIRNIMQQSNLKKTQPSIEYLGCSAIYFKEYISKKMTAEMTFENIHYDHIKPVSVFDLNDPDELLKCCHYTNFQPLLATDNLEKSNKWNDECEAFWRQNICGKEYLEIYNPFNS
jgi:hypothetical protein